MATSVISIAILYLLTLCFYFLFIPITDITMKEITITDITMKEIIIIHQFCNHRVNETSVVYFFNSNLSLLWGVMLRIELQQAG